MAAASVPSTPPGKTSQGLSFNTQETASTGDRSIRSTPLHGNKGIQKDRPRTMRDYPRSSRPPHYASRHTLASILRATPPQLSPPIGSIRSSGLQRPCRSPSVNRNPTSDDGPGSNDPFLADGSSESFTAPSSIDSPLSDYHGPTPKTLDEVRAAFFATKGLNLLSIKEWEWHCFHADMQVLATAVKSKDIDGVITGYNENDGFTGSAAIRGTLKMWLLSQAKFNGLKVLELWARLANPAWAAGMRTDDGTRWLVSPDWVDGLPLSHSAGFEDIEQELATLGGYGDGDVGTPVVDQPRGAAIKRLTAVEVDARVPAVQTRLFRKVVGDVLKRMGKNLSDARMEVKAIKRSQRSGSDQPSMDQWPWSEDGEHTDPKLLESDPKDEDLCPFSLVARSVNNILKSSYRKMDEQIAETDRARSVAEDLRRQLDEKLTLCDKVIQELGMSGRLAKDVKTQSNGLQECFLSLQNFKDQAGPHQLKIQETEKELSLLAEKLERYKFKSRLFDELCQEIKMMPYGLESADVAHVYFDALRDWVKTKEAAVERKWKQRESEQATDSLEETLELPNGVAVPPTSEEESFGSFESPDVSFSWAPSVDENGYEGAGEEDEATAIDPF